MALIRSPAVALTVVTVLSFLFAVSYGNGGMVGGKTEIRDVETNKEVQDLGRFSVEEYNRSLRQQQYHHHESDGGGELMFAKVVNAQKQVVSGIKYYLTISATHNGETKLFESVVVVKPWAETKQLLDFAPSRD
ncbi:Cysteine proteinase inhibitor [Quillaja saponaria]|uniref:Cysteine proteinase inhibitor n=1 Tax=Quillaja saponaria TaxID=32244 RepID=A0AAD7QD04_QUISA|nr:Cysteine proteinase inhibitor [Quillaja saponaria]